MKIIFSHGKESGPWGSKIKALASVAEQLGHEVESIDYYGIDSPDERVKKLNQYLQGNTALKNGKGCHPYILVGSSMGGYVSLVAAQTNKPQGVFLLAPALFMPGYAQQTYTTNLEHLAIVHGWSDDVIPVAHSIKYAQQTHSSLHLIDGDHRLNSSIEQVISLFRLFLLKL